jgi:hypothetical protein
VSIASASTIGDTCTYQRYDRILASLLTTYIIPVSQQFMFIANNFVRIGATGDRAIVNDTNRDRELAIRDPCCAAASIAQQSCQVESVHSDAHRQSCRDVHSQPEAQFSSIAESVQN